MTVPERFTREYGCSIDDWLRWLPGAAAGRAWRRSGPAVAEVDIEPGQLSMQWKPLPERRVALVRLPRLEVHFAFDGVAPAARAEFMRYFDLYTQRGGG
jgi:hypothetical protein